MRPSIGFESELKLRTVERCSCGHGLVCNDVCAAYEGRKSCPAFFKELMHPSMKVVVKTVSYQKRKSEDGGYKLEEVIRDKFPSKKDRRKMKRVKSQRPRR